MDKYAVFGHPIKQSKSPQIHQHFAQLTEQVIEYTAIDPGLNNFVAEIKRFIKQGAKGCNVTMPFKEQAFEIADHVTERARLAGAVNTLTFNQDGSISADNTDGAGLVSDLKSNNAPLNKRILLIGAGGAARGVIKPLLDCHPESLVIVNRTFEKANQLAKMFEQYGNIASIPLERITSDMKFDLIINSTSTSLSNELPPIPDSVFAKHSFSYDMVYKGEATRFLSWAKQSGSTTCVDGLGMLVGQAAESYYVWRAIKPEQANVLSKLRLDLSKN
ncbi:shikimate dehydrogenase [Thalassotalea sp. M1531]|uniref:Shikimate dehydrogenase (NADP(+)) n=1 Tax=Thalassotalea algicola TaxID=2716224 RepID=A0A7Y0LCX2_9GAMM|nr:shikimate dehydrogenase [Thalassotalea algicola]NMP30835.1 shikimate dehydrogenase [Thalassotalea algicola]